MNPVQKIDSTVFVAPSAELYGEISIGAHSSVWPKVVMRSENLAIKIGQYTNLQDFVMVHIGYTTPTIVGDFCSITHHATIHGCTIEDDCLIGINAVVMDGAVIGKGSIVAGGAMVKEGDQFGPGSIIAGVPAKKVAERDSSRANRMNAWHYVWNAEAYRDGQHRAWSGPDFEAKVQAMLKKTERDEDIAGMR